MRFVKKDHKICDSIMADQSSIIQFKKISGDSKPSITQFNCQVIIYTSPTRKVPENCMKCVQNRPKSFFFKIENIDSTYESFLSFFPEFNSKDY